MKANTVFFTHPDYIETFHCLGSRCEDTCCFGWQINVDRETYRKYQRIKDVSLRKTILNALQPVNSPESGQYSIILRPDNFCPLLTEDKLCSVHKALGEGGLCYTCATYPRTLNRMGLGIEESCMVSCPEAARVVLLNQSGISFKKTSRQIDADRRFDFYRDIPSKAMGNADRVEHYILQLRDFTISLLQNRAVKVSDRMVMLGMFCVQLQDYMQTGRVRELPALIKGSASIFSNPASIEGIAQLPVNVSFQMKFLKEVAEQKINAGDSWASYIKCFDDFSKGIGFTPGIALDECITRYKEAYEHYYRPFMDEREYILENFLVNHVFLTVFPLVTTNSFFDEYIIMVIVYSLIKMHLIGIAGFNKGLSDELVLNVIRSIYKSIEHNKGFVQGLLASLKQKNFATLGHMAILLKN